MLMIVEDDAQSLYLMERYAKRSGCRPVSTTRGENALALARQEQPAAIFLDLMLLGTSGWDILRDLQADSATRDIPVILCSGLNEVEDGLEAGAAACLRKPVYYQDFLDALRQAGVEPPGRE
jgi:CheY-like chemotaxis protein